MASKQGKRWKASELAILYHLACEGNPTCVIAEKLERTISAIETKAFIHGIKLEGRQVQSWRDDEVKKLYALENTLTVLEVAEKLDRTIASVKSKAFRLGVNFRDGRGNK